MSQNPPHDLSTGVLSNCCLVRDFPLIKTAEPNMPVLRPPMLQDSISPLSCELSAFAA
jgi:hypothetical protein